MKRGVELIAGLVAVLVVVATSDAARVTLVAGGGMGGAAEKLRQSTGTPIDVVERPRHEGKVAAARAALGEDAFAAAWAEGQAMTLEEMIAAAAYYYSRI